MADESWLLSKAESMQLSRLLIILFCMSSIGLKAQVIKDKAALKLVNKLEKKYDKFNTLEATFDLIIEIPENEKQTQSGRVVQKGDQYYLDTEAQSVYSDGKSIWLYLKNEKEVQINSIDEEEDLINLSPKGILAMFDKDKFEYAITQTENDISHIEIKPMDSDVDYFKVRLIIDTNSNELKESKVFYRDGMVTTLVVNDIMANKEYAAGTFTFDPTSLPDVHVEDLRF